MPYEIARWGEAMSSQVNPYVTPAVRCAGPGCEHVRKEANHWFVVAISHTLTFCCFPYRPELLPLNPWELPVCGQACAQKLFEHWMQKGKL